METSTYLGYFSASCQVLFQVVLYSRMQLLGEGTVKLVIVNVVREKGGERF
jgi:hypothetical protein